MKAQVIIENCTGCKCCEDVCSKQAIIVDNNISLAIVNKAECDGCGICVDNCLQEAIILSEE